MARPELNITVSSNSTPSKTSSTSVPRKQDFREAPAHESRNAQPSPPLEDEDEEAFPQVMIFGATQPQQDVFEPEGQEEHVEQDTHIEQQEHIERQKEKERQEQQEAQREREHQRQQQQRNREQQERERQERQQRREQLQSQHLQREQEQDLDHSDPDEGPRPPTKASSYRRAAAAVASRLRHATSNSGSTSIPGGNRTTPEVNPFASGVFDVASEPRYSNAVVASVETPLQNGWRPQWLRRMVLAIFAVVFALLVVAAELVLKLVEGKSETHYVGVWTFGPVVAASILLVLWSRVESQCTYYMPWIVISQPITSTADIKRKDASKTLLLDYPSMWFFQRIPKSFVNGHYLVTASTFNSLVIRVQIMLSTGIFRLDLVATDRTLLAVQPAYIHAAAVLYGLSMLLVLPMLYWAPSPDGITPRDPTTLAGTAALLRNSRQVLDRLRGSGAEDKLSIQDRLLGSWTGSHSHRPSRTPDLKYSVKELESKHSYAEKRLPNGDIWSGVYHPWTMRAVAFTITIICSAALLAALWALHQTRGSNGQLSADADGIFLWSCLVTLIFLLLSSYVGALDADSRRLTPYLKMTTRDEAWFGESIGLAYSDDLGLWSAMKALQFEDWGVFVAKCTTFVAFLAPIFSAGLFALSKFDSTGYATLKPQTFFDINSNAKSPGPDTGLAQQVLLDSTPKYPPNTYEAFALPSLAFEVNHEAWESSYMNFTTTVQATEAGLNCQSQVFSGGDGLTLNCKALNSTGIKGCSNGQPYVGFVADSCANLTLNAPLNYVWGQCDKDGIINVLMCNETFATVDVQVPYVNGDLQIDPSEIVVAVDGTKRPLHSTLTLDGVYGLLRGTPAGNDKTSGLDDFFRTLVQSHLSVPVERLGAPDRSNSVIQGIQMQHGIVRAQALNSGAVRVPISNKATSSDKAVIQTPYSYTMLELIQANPQTYALTTLLSLLIILSLISLLIRPRKASLPKSPTSIAAQASLLADSTLWSHLPRGAEFMSDAQLAHRLRKKTFKLGVIDQSGPSRRGRNFTIGIVQDAQRPEKKPRRFHTPTRMLSNVSLRRHFRSEQTIDEEEDMSHDVFADPRVSRIELEGDHSFMYDLRESDEDEWEEEGEILRHEKGHRAPR